MSVGTVPSCATGGGSTQCAGIVRSVQGEAVDGTAGGDNFTAMGDVVT